MPTRLARPLRRRYDKAGVVHAEWFENVLPEMYIQWLAAHRLHDAADPIDVAAVLPALPGIEHQRLERKPASVGGRQLVEGSIISQRLTVPQAVDEAGRVGEEVTERNRPLGRPQQWLAALIEAIEDLRRGDRRIDIRHRRLERELALLDQPQRGHRRDQLHHGGDTENRVARHRRPFMNAPAAKDPFVEDAGFGCGHGDHARHILGADGGAQDGIDSRQRSSCCIRCLRRPRWGAAA